MDAIQMKEQFCFPSHLGSIQEGSYFTVEPKWIQHVEEQTIVLEGVYLLKGYLQFDFQPQIMEQQVDAILIEQVEVETTHTYFEYALPFVISVPNANSNEATLQVEQFQLQCNGGFLECSWQANCTVSPLLQETAAVAKEIVDQVVAEMEPKATKIEQVVAEMEPKVVKIEPIVAEMEPKIVKIEPIVDEIEPKVVKIEPIVDEVEPKVVEKEPIAIKMEPKATKNEPKAIKMESKAPKNELSADELVGESAIADDVALNIEKKEVNELDFLEQLAEAYEVWRVPSRKI